MMPPSLLPHGVRTASSADLAALRALGLDDETLRLPLAIPGARYLLVLDAQDGSIAAAAHVLIEPPRAILALVAVQRAYANREVGEHLLSVVVALCETFGCRSLEMPAEANTALADAA
jgi:N-acetylglutamate synthase-like GNAT family acetyltransferase